MVGNWVIDDIIEVWVNFVGVIFVVGVIGFVFFEDGLVFGCIGFGKYDVDWCIGFSSFIGFVSGSFVFGGCNCVIGFFGCF